MRGLQGRCGLVSVRRKNACIDEDFDSVHAIQKFCRLLNHLIWPSVSEGSLKHEVSKRSEGADHTA